MKIVEGFRFFTTQEINEIFKHETKVRFQSIKLFNTALAHIVIYRMIKEPRLIQMAIKKVNTSILLDIQYITQKHCS